ncbi:universal stress protein [Gillisia marina]|uniref:universal stress protein n=1 Tax=Gillisia marina TaxID=1167637 RepID=UPI000299ED00|nr:universal stress protein [Gillisia marina]
MRKILVPTDFSNSALNALRFALSLFKDDATTFYLLNAFQLYYFTTESLLVPEPGEPAYDEAKDASETGLDHVVDQIAIISDSRCHQFQTISSYNNLINAIDETVENYKIELIVMGTKGNSDPATSLFGSNAVSVIENIKKCPLLIIPEQTPYLTKASKEIVLATNYKTPYRLKEISYLKDIAQKYEAAIRILYIKEHKQVSDEQLSNKHILQEYLKDVPHTFHTLNHIKVLQGIRSFIESRESTMLALVDKKHSFLYNLFSKSILKEIGYKPKIPILVLHDSEL